MHCVATFKLQPDTIKLLSDETKVKFDEKGNITYLAEINEELKSIAEDFSSVFLTYASASLKWLSENQFADFSIPCFNQENYQLELFCGKNFIRQKCIEEKQLDGSVRRYFLKCDKEGHFNKELLSEEIPYERRIVASFDKSRDLLHVVLSPKILFPISKTLRIVEPGLCYDERNIDIDPQSSALYKLFFIYTAGIVPKDILTVGLGYIDKFFELYENEWNPKGKSDNPYNLKRQVLKWNLSKRGKIEINRKIHRMLNVLNNSLGKVNDNFIELYKIRQLHSKSKGDIYFIPLIFLNEIDVKIRAKCNR